MININVFSNERAWSKRLKKKNLFFTKICKAFPKKYRFLNKKVSLTVLLSNNKIIKKLNKEFRGKNKSTDILSFPFAKNLKVSKQIYIGDIIISYNFIDKPKTQKLKLFEKKLIKIFIHGFLHLLGFVHLKNKEYNKMLIDDELIFQSLISKLN